jgi:hypothetical protein
MQEPWLDNTNKYNAAKQLIIGLIDSMWQINKEVEFGLNVFGHLYPKEQNNCKDSRREVNFTKDNLGQLTLRIEALQPKGTASVSYALQEALQMELIDTGKYNYTVIVVTDSNSVCEKEFCNKAEHLNKVTNRNYLIQLDKPENTKFDCFGRNKIIITHRELQEAINTILEPYRKIHTRTSTVIKTMQVIQAPVINPIAVPKPAIKTDTVTPIKQEQPITKLPLKSPQPIITTKWGNIKVAEIEEPEKETKYGYIKFVNATSVYAISLYLKKDTEYDFYMKFESEQLNDKRIKIREGKYKGIYNNKEKEFIILPNMITEVDLK